MANRPRWLTAYPNTSRGPECCEFIERFCRVTKDTMGGRAGELIVLRPWQRALINGLLATRDGHLIHRKALIGLPRKNGKTSLLSGVMLWALVTGGMGVDLFSFASSLQQANLVFDTAKQMVAMDDELSKLLAPFKRALTNETTHSSYQVMPAKDATAHGLNPYFAAYDEVHLAHSRDLWDAIDTGRQARRDSLLIGITTAGSRTDSYGRDTLAYELYQYGKRVANGEIDDPTFFFAWWEPQDVSADWQDSSTWKDANPGYDDLILGSEFSNVIKSTPEPTFRTLHLNQWVATTHSWLPSGAWDACLDSDRTLSPGVPVVFGFDGSRTNDCTALVMATAEKNPHITVLALWERPQGDQHWRVKDSEVLPVIRALADEWHPVEIVCDEAYWRDQLEDLADEGYPVISYPQRGSMMGHAAQGFYEAVLGHHLTHDGDARLARHIDNAVLKYSGGTSRINKESSMSNRKIDLATAAVMAVARARANQDEEGLGIYSASDINQDDIQQTIREHQEYMRSILAEARNG